MAAFDQLAAQPGLPPMEAKQADALPQGNGWRYEPKWDGFRCIAYRQGDAVHLQSKAGKPLGRYFPEVVDRLLGLRPRRFILDGELIIPVGDILSFEALQMRLHPAESRIRKLAAATPARLMLFDCLDDGTARLHQPLAERRDALERLCADADEELAMLSPYTEDRAQAAAWLDLAGGALDGVIAKRADAPYQPGERAMLKIKQLRGQGRRGWVAAAWPL
jgi:ATP-dependent DNA ligase